MFLKHASSASTFYLLCTNIFFFQEWRLQTLLSSLYFHFLQTHLLYPCQLNLGLILFVPVHVWKDTNVYKVKHCAQFWHQVLGMDNSWNYGNNYWNEIIEIMTGMAELFNIYVHVFLLSPFQNECFLTLVTLKQLMVLIQQIDLNF